MTERKQGLTDEQAKAIMKRVSGCESASAFQGLEAKRQKEVLSKMLKKGVSVRQAARMTGVPKTTVARFIGWLVNGGTENRPLSHEVCFLDGGRGAPQACDTVETLAALGVKNIVAVGMCGAFDPRVEAGQIIAPSMAFVEEGTSLHYYPSIDYAAPDGELLDMAASQLQVSAFPIVTTDAVYRQTFEKERLWREKGAVAVDMETSAVFSVSRYLGSKAVGLLMISDVHPIHPGDTKWDWQMTKEMRYELAEKGLNIARRFRIER